MNTKETPGPLKGLHEKVEELDRQMKEWEKEGTEVRWWNDPVRRQKYSEVAGIVSLIITMVAPLWGIVTWFASHTYQWLLPCCAIWYGNWMLSCAIKMLGWPRCSSAMPVKIMWGAMIAAIVELGCIIAGGYWLVSAARSENIFYPASMFVWWAFACCWLHWAKESATWSVNAGYGKARDEMVTIALGYMRVFSNNLGTNIGNTERLMTLVEKIVDAQLESNANRATNDEESQRLTSTSKGHHGEKGSDQETEQVGGDSGNAETTP